MKLFGAFKRLSGINAVNPIAEVGPPPVVPLVGSIFALGANGQNQIADGSISNKTSITASNADSDWSVMATGQFHSIAIKTDGTLWGRGNNSSRAAGGATSVDFAVWTQIGTGTDWRLVNCGRDFSYAIKTDGTIWGWGDSGSNRLGTVSSDTGTPTQIGTDSDWATVASGVSATMAIKTDGTIWGIGSGSGQKLGPDGVNRSVWTQIELDTDWSAVYAGANANFFIALKTDGTLWGIGNNVSGQLGRTGANAIGVWTQLGSDSDWETAATGGVPTGAGHTVAIKSNGTLWGWGNNSSNQMGTGVFGATGVQIGTAANWDKVSAGDDFTVMLTDGGAIWGMGANASGELSGSGSESTPTLINDSFTWLDLVAGESHNLFLR